MGLADKFSVIHALQSISQKAGAASQEAAQKELAEMMVKAKEMAEKEEAEAAAAARQSDVSPTMRFLSLTLYSLFTPLLLPLVFQAYCAHQAHSLLSFEVPLPPTLTCHWRLHFLCCTPLTAFLKNKNYTIPIPCKILLLLLAALLQKIDLKQAAAQRLGL